MTSPGPLHDIVVADFSRVLAGPLATMVLGDLGADVIKVERPGSGDDTRGWGPPHHDGQSTYFLGLNRNKRSVALDLADAADLELARRLAARADVLVESFRPGLMRSWGLDRDSLASVNPGLVTLSVTAFGSSPQAEGLPGYDLLLQAMGGLMSVTGEPGGRPMKAGAAVIDLVCGLLGTVAVLAALNERERTGAGRHVEVSLLESALLGLLNQGSGWLLAGALPGRRGNRHPSIAPYDTYAAADRPFALAVGNDRLWRRLCSALELNELGSDPRLATNEGRVANVEELTRSLATIFEQEPSEHWIERCRSAGVPAGPINDVAEAFELARALGLEPIAGLADRDGRVRPAPSPVLGEVRLPPPRLDEHGTEIRSWLSSS